MVDVFFCALQSLGRLYCKVINAYLHVGVSIVYASIFNVAWLFAPLFIHVGDPALRSFLVPINYGEQVPPRKRATRPLTRFIGP